MKRNRVLKTALALFGAVALIPAASAIAFAEGEESVTVFPDSLEQTLVFDDGLTDYAVCGDTFAFASGSDVYFLSNDGNDTTLDSRTFSTMINRLDYEGGELYIEYISGTTFKLSAKDVGVDHSFPDGQKVSFTEQSVYYYIDVNGALNYVAIPQPSVIIGDGYTDVKTYDGRVYAIKENVLYRFDGATPVAADMSYTDSAKAKNIKTGNTAQALKSGYDVKFATLTRGEYYIRIDPDQSDENFKLLYEEKEEESVKKSTAEIPCMILCETGNASLITINGECYIVATSSLTGIRDYSSHSTNWGDKPAYVVETTSIYSRPYMCESTKIGTAVAGADTRLTILEEFSDLNDNAYYKVSYGEGDDAVCGYISSNFITEYSFSSDNMPEVEKGDGKDNFEYDNNVLTVTLTTVIVVLVIVAALYLYLSYCKKSKKRKKEKEERKREKEAQKAGEENGEEYDEDEEDEEDYEEEPEQYDNDERSYQASSYWDEEDGE